MQNFDAELESLFIKYANYEVLKKNENKCEIKVEAAIQSEPQKQLHQGIELPQLYYWLENAKLVNRRFTIADLSLLFMKYNKLRLDYVDFLDLLQKLCRIKSLDLGKLQAKLLEAREPEYYEFFATRERLYGKKYESR